MPCSTCGHGSGHTLGCSRRKRADVERCELCGNSVTCHQNGCANGSRTTNDAQDVQEYTYPHWNENGFLQLDLRVWCVDRTRRDLQALLRGLAK